MPKSSGLPMQYRIAKMQEEERTRRQGEAVPQQLLMGLGQTILNMGSTLGVDAVKYFGMGGQEREEVALGLGRAQTEQAVAGAEGTRTTSAMQKEQTSLLRPQFDENVRAKKRAEKLSGAALEQHLPEGKTLETASNADIGFAFKKLDALLGKGGRGWQAVGTQVTPRPKRGRRGPRSGLTRKQIDKELKIHYGMRNGNMLEYGPYKYAGEAGREAKIKELEIARKYVSAGKKGGKSLAEVQVEGDRLNLSKGTTTLESSGVNRHINQLNQRLGPNNKVKQAPKGILTNAPKKAAANMSILEKLYEGRASRAEDGSVVLGDDTYANKNDAIGALSALDTEILFNEGMAAFSATIPRDTPVEERRARTAAKANDVIDGMLANQGIFATTKPGEPERFAPILQVSE